MRERPLISIVSAVHDVARYLPDFIASLERQRGVDLSTIEVVAVDDGSTDSSPELLRDWQRRSRLRVTVLSKENGGQGSARNVGIEHATGTWVTFADPDDMITPRYLTHVLRFAARHPDVAMIATNRVFLRDSTGRRSDSHPLRWMFAAGERLVDLDREPHHFHGSAPAAFVRRSRVVEQGLRFDERIRPNFEDGHFCVRYLLGCPAPTIGYVPSAVYLYRTRADGTSTLQTANAQLGRYTDVPRYGYLDVLRTSARRSGRAPVWVQTFILYELSWYFAAELGAGASTVAAGVVGDRFVELLTQIRDHLDEDVIEQFSLCRFDPEWRQILLHGLSTTPWHSSIAVTDAVDRQQGLVRVVHRFNGPEPQVEYLARQEPVTPVHTKIRTHVYFGRPLLRERIAWLPDVDGLRVRLGDGTHEPEPSWPFPGVGRPTGPRPNPGRRQVAVAREALREPRRVLGAVRVRARRAVLPRLARTAAVGERFDGAWVLVDRIDEADDNAEHLFRYLRRHRADINAWFVIEKRTADWARLRAEFGDRVVAYGSIRWQLLMLRCRHLVSSHIDVPVHRPRVIAWTLGDAEPPWRFTFLQHGVIKDDISGWLNGKATDLFVTSTPGEFASIAGDDSPYAVTTKEVRLTGLPRFDRLRGIAGSLRPEDRDLLLVAPTWRQGLLGPPMPVTGHRRVRADFPETDYARNWLGLLRSAELAEIAHRHGLRVGFLPHPLLQEVLPRLDLPAHVEPLTFDGAGAQRLFAGAAVFVTDYSSMAFNVAYVDRPVVYFQFDAESIYTGGHIGRAGYFDYDRDGFGPVTRSVDGAVAAIRTIVDGGCVPSAQFQGRIDETFVLRDGRCCERVATEIERLTLPAVEPGFRPSDRPVPVPSSGAAHQVDEPPAAGDVPRLCP